MIEGILPEREGVHAPAEVAQDGPATAPLRVAPGALLGEYARDYAFFNHGVLYTRGRIGCDLLSEYVATSAGDVAITTLRFDTTVVAGIDLPTDPHWRWDRLLCAVPHAQWPPLYDFLRAVSIRDHRRRTLALATVSRWSVVDPLALGRAVLPDPVPAVAVTLFGLDASFGDCHFVLDRSGPLPRPRLEVAAARTATLALARGFLDESQPKPFSVVGA